MSSKWAKGTGGPAGDEVQNLVTDVVGPLLAGSSGGSYRVGADEAAMGHVVPVCSVTGEIAHAHQSVGADASEDGTGRGTPIVAVIQDCRAIDKKQNGTGIDCDPSVYDTLDQTGQQGVVHQAVPFTIHSAESCAKQRHAFETETARVLDSTGGFASGQSGAVVVQSVAAVDVAAPLTAGVSKTAGVNPPGRRQEDDTNLVVECFQQNQRDEVRSLGDLAGAVQAQHGMKQQNYVAFHATQDPISSQTVTPCLGTGSQSGGGSIGVAYGTVVRRLTPTECLRLQGLPDDWLDGLDLSDSAKYRMIGNAGAVSCLTWIGLGLHAAENGWLDDPDFKALREMACRHGDELAARAIQDWLEEHL